MPNKGQQDIMRTFKNKHFFINIILFIILPFVINMILESLGNQSFTGGVKKLISDPYVFLCNTLIIASTLSFGVFFKRFRCCWIVIVSTVWLILGTINYIIVCNRVLPFTAYDFRMVDALPFIIRKYLNPFTMAVVCLGIVVVLLGLFVIFFRSLEAPKEKLNFKSSFAFFAIIISLSFGNLKYATASGALETHFHELEKSYIKNGFAYSFSVSLFDNGVDKVDGYSEELIHSITDGFVKTDSENIKTPNIIFVQMESFFDLNSLSCVKFSENPVPNFTRLASENPSGLFTVPVIGAGTVNTEFEVVTGMRVFDFGAGEYPYKTLLTENTCESIATNLKNHGYTSHFLHNYKGKFYGRDNVYANLGYDNFYSIEYMTGYETNENGWAKDKILLRYIEESLNSTEGSDLITAISVQGHGGYSDIKDYTKHITVTDCDNKSMRSSYEYYANQVYEMDSFLGSLVDFVSQRDEESILVVYGDHLPSLEFENGDLNGRGIYQTDYFIWNNLGLEYNDEDLAAYQISSKILDSVNITDGVINSCHQQYKNDKQYLFNLQALEYDTLYGEKHAYDGENPYEVSKMKKNRRNIKIVSVTKKEGDEKTYIISGEGFSARSYVRIGYMFVPTTYIDENTLEFKRKNLDPKASISVWEKNIGDSNNFYFTESLEGEAS